MRVVPCDKIFKRILTDFGFCFSFNILDFGEIFSENISEDFESFRGEKVSQWSLHGGYKTEEQEVYPVRASKNSPLSFVVSWI